MLEYDLTLVKPNKSLENQIMDYRQEFIKHNEGHVNGSCSLHRFESFNEWMDRVNICATEETNQYYNTITTTFLAIRKSDNKIIGTIQVRHILTKELRDDSGNIGYAVRPTERRKGYATQMLNLALEFCRSLGLDKVLLDCDETNIASEKTMIKCGGIFDRNQFIRHTNGDIEKVHQYWIYL